MLLYKLKKIINFGIETIVNAMEKVLPKMNKDGEVISRKAIEYAAEIITNSPIPIVAHAGRIWMYIDGVYLAIDSVAKTDNLIKMSIMKMDKVKFVDAKIIASVQSQLFLEYYDLSPYEDPDVTYINMKSNVLALHKNGTLELLPHDQKYNFTYKLPYDYDAKALSPVFDKFLATSLVDSELIDVLGEYLGYILNTNAKNHEKAFFAYGDGSNGKSTLINIIKYMFGHENISVIELTEMGDEGNCAMMDGKLLNISSDSKKNGLETSSFKKIVSGEPIIGKYLYKNKYTIEKLPKLFVAMNKLPFHNGDNSFGFYRRLLLIPFTVTIKEEDKDYDLETKVVENELPAILNFAIDGMRRLTAQGKFTEAVAMKEALNSYKESANHVSTFLEEEQYEEVADDSKMGTKLVDLYQDFHNWCRERGHNSYNANYLSSELTHMGYIGYKNSSKHFRLIKRKLENETGFKQMNNNVEKSPYEKNEN